MKKTFIILFLFIGFLNAFAQNSLTGKISDKLTGEPLIGASIYISELKKGALTDVDGIYKINNLSSSRILVQVNQAGYKTIIETIDLSQTSSKDFEMEVSIKEVNEVVVTGVSSASEKNRTPTPISVVGKTELLQTSSTNIIDAIASQPGISQVTTGTGISKPVIRGLGYNRVVVVNDGIRQEGQQWGDEHGIEIDEFGVERVEILKGPASLTYGSDAMAGVINMISAPTIPDGGISGNVLGTLQTNNGQYGYSANIAGNVKGLIWDLRYSGKQAHSYQNKYDGYVYGSGFKENTFGGILGVNKSWGYSHLHFSTYHLVPGIVEGERDSASGKFVKEFALDDSTSAEEIVSPGLLRSYTIGIPHQDIQHSKAVLNSNVILGNGYLKTILGFQQNKRKEFGDILNPDDYGLFFLLKTINYDVRYLFPEKNDWSISTGVNGMHQSSENKGTEFLVPEYRLLDAGIFLTAKKSMKKLDFSGGIRFDTRSISSEELILDTLGIPSIHGIPNNEQKFKAFSSRFSSVSGSLGAAYKISDDAFTKLNISRGFRAPNIAELGANGEHEGTGRYEIGDPDLKAEYSLQMDYSLGLNTEHLTAEADLFYNHISNFIYTSKLNSFAGGDSIVNSEDPIPTFKFRQGNANLVGGEVTVDIHPHPLDWLHFENTFSYVQSAQEKASDSTKYLPFTPAAKFTTDLRANVKRIGKLLGNAYIKLGVDHYFEQDKFYSAYGTETKTPAYTLLNIGAGTDVIKKGKTLFSFFINVNNLTDAAYQSHLSRLKYAAENFTTGRRGVFNMGRNISLKIIVPFNLRKSA